MYNKTACGDGLLGPKVASDACRGGFDFTLAFEETILTILPSVIFILATCPRIFYLLRGKDQTSRQSTYTPKLITCGLYASLQIAQLAVVATAKSANTKFTIATAAVNVIAAFFITVLSHAEHVKTIRPSFMIFSYLFLSLVCDGARLRTEWLISVNGAYASLLSTAFALKVSILILESVEKRDILLNKINPPSNESTSGPVSRGFFLWLNSLLLSGWATVLTNKDLPTIYESLSSEKLAVRFNTVWENALRRRAKPSLFLSTVWTIKWDILSAAMPRLAAVALVICRPLLISNALDFLNSPESSSKTNLGYGLIAAFALVFVGSAIMTAWYEHLLFRAAGMVRGGLITLVYRKMLRLPVTGLSDTSAVALMGNDIETLAERSGMLFVECWANLITVIISLWMLSQHLGAVCVVPILFALVSLFGCTSLGKPLGRRQVTWQKASQDRINFISEVIGSIKAVKMLGFSDKFTESIRAKRINDIARGKKFRWMIVWLNGISNANESLTQVATFAAFAVVAKLRGDTVIFSGSQAITTLSILGVLSLPLAELLGCIAPAFGTLACFKRVEDFLMLPERRDSRMVRGQRVLSASESDLNSCSDIPMKDLITGAPRQPATVAITDGTFKWSEEAVLSDINTSMPETDGSLTVIVGPIGCGKSSLLKAILGEAGTESGTVSLSHPDVAYCDQTPWIMDASIHDNIVGESRDNDEVWYANVIDACDLKQDLAQLPEGDATLVGDKGLKLSGGQKQRIAVARALFARKKIAMFDDVFSGLDKVTERNIFARVFSKEGLLHKNGTTVILATHSVHHLVDADYVIALAKGGRIIEQGTYQRLQATGTYVKDLNVEEPYSSDEEDYVKANKPGTQQDGEPELTNATSNATNTEEEDTKLASDRSTFKYYFLSMGRFALSLIFFSILGSGVLQNLRSVWVSWWGDGVGHSSNDLGYWLGIFVMLAVADVSFIMSSIGFTIVLAGPNAGISLHERLLQSVMSAPMSVLANVESGSLVNRFSQDMRFVDMVLPVAMSIFLMDASIAIGALGIAIAAVKWLAIVTPIVLLLLIVVQRFYVRTSKQLRLLEIENKAPMYGHFLESIHGLSTIRAFGWVDQYSAKNMRLLDAAQKPWYLLNCIQRWLNLVLDLIVAIVVVVMMAIAVAIRDKISPSLLGVALVQMSNLGLSLKGIIIQWSTLETSLGAVTRIKTFVDTTPSEHLPSENHQPPQDWLARGTLDFRNAAIQYSETASPVVSNVTFSIKSGEKIGLCGRSGSGKSSTIQALVRMADVSEGKILLDGQDITKVPRQLIRQKLSCLTQEPILFTNTIRFNADPLEEHTDEEITSALKRVGIWDVILAKSTVDTDILGQKMSESFLSHGQRQLFCLGRALLKESSILILDEPTSSVDKDTDAAVQSIIRSEFKGRTILMIAHRLNTLLDFDKIAVLEKGRLVEFDTPTALLNNKNGCFSALYRADNGKNV